MCPDRFHMLECGVRPETLHDSAARPKAIENSGGENGQDYRYI